MYCKNCGQENEDHALYCFNDGMELHENKNNTNLAITHAKFCKECGKNIEPNDLYCGECGASLYGIEKASQSPIEGMPSARGSKSKIRDIHIVGTIIRGAIALAIIFIISLILSSKLNTTIIDSIIGGRGDGLKIKLISALDLALLTNLSRFKIAFSALGEGNIRMSLVMPFLLILPIAIFFLMGILEGIKDNKLKRSMNYMNILALGICYGLMLGLISLISVRSYSMGGYIFGGTATFKKSHNFLIVMINSILISVISQILGYGTFTKLKKWNRSKEPFGWLFDSASIIVASFIGIFIITSVIFLSGVFDSNPQNADVLGRDTALGVIANTIFSLYSLLMASFSTLYFKFDGGSLGGVIDFIDGLEDQDISFKSSLIGGMDDLKPIIGTKLAFLICLMVLIPIVIFFIKGMKSKKQGYGSINKSIGLPVISYSVILSLMAYLTSFRFSGSLSELGVLEALIGLPGAKAFIGFKFIPTLLGSFILTGISAMAGFLLGKKDEIQEVTSDE